MKTITLVLFAIFFANSSKAQEWQTSYEEQGIIIQYRHAEIDDAQLGIHHARIVFRYENKTSSEVHLNFNRTIIYSGDQEEKPQEKGFNVTIPANSSIEYNEANRMDKTYYLFEKDLKRTIKRSLVNFDIKDVTLN
jgi:hypothetical protein